MDITEIPVNGRIRIDLWQLTPGVIECAVYDPFGTRLTTVQGRTVGRVLIAAGMNMCERDHVDFMDAVLAGRK